MESYTIRETNEIIRVGDCVLMRSLNEKAPLVGCVMTFEVNHEEETGVRVRWYYRPEEVYGGRRPFHGEKELFLSGHYDYQRADNIEGKCIVHDFQNYTKLKDIRPEDYYCRFEYNVSTGEFTPDFVQVYCKCEMPRNPDQLMVKCEGCKDLYHPACVGMTTQQAKEDSYMCSDCEPKDNIKNPSSAFSNDMESNESSKGEALERAQKLIKKVHVAEKSVIGKRKRAMFDGAVNTGGSRFDEQISLDMIRQKDEIIASLTETVNTQVNAKVERMREEIRAEMREEMEQQMQQKMQEMMRSMLQQQQQQQQQLPNVSRRRGGRGGGSSSQTRRSGNG